MRTTTCPMVSALAVVTMLGLATPADAAETRDSLLEKATAHWRLGDGGRGARHPLTQVGEIQLNVAAEGDGATPGAKVARLHGGYFDAGKALDLASAPTPDSTSGKWIYRDGKLSCGPEGGACRFNVPDDHPRGDPRVLHQRQGSVHLPGL